MDPTDEQKRLEDVVTGIMVRDVSWPSKRVRKDTPPDAAKVVVLVEHFEADIECMTWRVIPQEACDAGFMEALRVASDDLSGAAAEGCPGDGDDDHDGGASYRVREGITEHMERGEEISIHELFRRMRRGACKADFFWYHEYGSNRDEIVEVERLPDEEAFAEKFLDWACETLGIADGVPVNDFVIGELEHIHRVSIICMAATEYLDERYHWLGKGPAKAHWRSTGKKEA